MTTVPFDTYVDLWHYDKKLVPSYGTLWPSEPWEITSATERLVADNKLAYSKSEANIKQIDQLSLNLPVQSELIKQELIKMSNEKYIPNALKGLVSLEYALKRYQSSIDWIQYSSQCSYWKWALLLANFQSYRGSSNLKCL